MKKLRKTAVTLAASSVLASLAVVGAANAETFVTAASPKVELNQNGGDINPLTVDKEWTDTFCCQSTVTRTFNINPGYGHVKLFIQNHASTEITVNLKHRDTGLVYFTKTIKGKEDLDCRSFNEGYPQGMRSGDYNLVISGGGNDVNGQY